MARCCVGMVMGALSTGPCTGVGNCTATTPQVYRQARTRARCGLARPVVFAPPGHHQVASRGRRLVAIVPDVDHADGQAVWTPLDARAPG